MELRIKISFLVILILLLHSCTTVVPNNTQPSALQLEKNRRQYFVNSHPNLPEETKQNILNGVIQFGMTKDMIVAILGNPNRTKRAGDASGIREVWAYYEPLPELEPSSLAGLSTADIALAYSLAQKNRKVTYLFFENGIFTSFKEE